MTCAFNGKKKMVLGQSFRIRDAKYKLVMEVFFSESHEALEFSLQEVWGSGIKFSYRLNFVQSEYTKNYREQIKK